MSSVKIFGAIALWLLCFQNANGQETDSIRQTLSWQKTKERNSFPLKAMVIPSAFIVYGVVTLENHGLQDLNFEVKEELYLEHPHNNNHLDNFLQFAPALAVYGLNAMGIKGKNNFRDRSMIYLLSNITLNITVSTIKKSSHQLRPDGSDYASFPSGHTAEAFASAEFMRQEYKDLSPWYGVAGYAMAAATGYLRMYNNKHWLSDVAAGAGIGIISTRLAYWVYPTIKHILFKDKPVNTLILPTYKSGAFGLALTHHF